jgi:hypothetical protein
MFHSVTGNCVGLMVQELDCACEQGLASMVRVTWSVVEQVGDQSLYSRLVQAMRSMVPRLTDCLQTSRKYFIQFCIKFVSSFIPKFISNLYKCKPVGTVGAEQLLLTTHSLKTVLVDLPSLMEAGQVRPVGRKAPQDFTQVVVKGALVLISTTLTDNIPRLTRAEMILKVIMSPLELSGAFVEQYVRLVQGKVMVCVIVFVTVNHHDVDTVGAVCRCWSSTWRGWISSWVSTAWSSARTE